MKSLFIMGLPRSGTTVTRDLFEEVPDLKVLREVGIDVLAKEMESESVVWKSPVNCMDRQALSERFPDAVQVHIIRDGRQNLAAHKRYLEVYGRDYLWGAYRGRGLKGFADLWNDFAKMLVREQIWFRLEDLQSDAGELIIKGIYSDCAYPGLDRTLQFWKKFVYCQDIQGNIQDYPRKAISLSTPAWQDCLTIAEAEWINYGLLGEFGYE